MKIWNYGKLVLLLISMLSIIFFAQCSGLTESDTLISTKLDQSSADEGLFSAKQGEGELTDQEKEDLLFIREDEKLARDIYNIMFAKWGTPIFDRIAISEQRHMDAVKRITSVTRLTEKNV